MKYSEEQLMKEIQKVGFAVVDLHLYLDTHPTDTKALMLYNQYAEQLKMLKEMYSKQFGPIDQHDPSYKCPFGWIVPPWPWQRFSYMCKEDC